MLQGDIPRATKGVKDLVAWQKAERPRPRGRRKASTPPPRCSATASRCRSGTSAKDPAAKKAAEDRAFAVLLELNEKQPELRPIIAEQLIEMMGDDVDVKKAELLVLQALVSRGCRPREAIEDAGKPDAAADASRWSRRSRRRAR